MQYGELVQRVADETGTPVDIIKEVLMTLPTLMLSLQEGEQVRTPFGVFRATVRKERQVRIPESDQYATIPSKFIVKLKPGSRLQKDVAASCSEKTSMPKSTPSTSPSS